MDDLVITKPSDLIVEILAKRVYAGDCTWIIKGDKNENRKNVYSSMKEYWEGTYEQ